MKLCKKCNIEKPFDEMSKHKKSKDGYRNICKNCEYDRVKKYKKINPQVQRNYIKRYEQKHKNELTLAIKELRNKLRFALKPKKNYKDKELIFGCTAKFLKQYIETHFESWMNWENKSLYNGTLNYGWDVDHIIQLNTANNRDDVIRLNHYSNLRPLCTFKNRVLENPSFKI